MSEEQKTASDIIEEVKCEICDHYCRYPYEIDDEDTLYNEYCKNCPLGRL